MPDITVSQDIDDFMQSPDDASARAELGLGSAATSNTTDFAQASHTHATGDITGLDTAISTNADVAANSVDRHNHTNKAILDATTASYNLVDESKVDNITITQPVNLDILELDSHTHSNKTVLDATTASFTAADQTTLGTALQPNDNISSLTNDTGYITSAPVDSVNTKTGAVVLNADDIDDSTTAHKFATAQQLANADNALQSGDNVSSLTNDSGYLTSALQATDIDTLAELNAIVGDATLIDTNDSRLSDSRTPTAHTHPLTDLTQSGATDGQVAAWNNTAGEWQPVTPASGAVDSVNSQTGVVVLDADDIDDTSTTNKFATQAELNAIGTSLQPSDIGATVQGHSSVLDATTASFTTAKDTTLSNAVVNGDNVSSLTNDANYIKEADTSVAPFSFVINDDTMATASDTNLPTSDSVKQFVLSQVASTVTYQGSYDAATNTPNLDSSPTNVGKGDMFTVTVAGTFYTQNLEVGDVLIAESDNPTTLAGWTVVNKDLDAASIKSSYESNADTNAFTNTYKSNVDQNTIDRHTHTNKAVLDATTASFETADETKLDFITITQAVDLDSLETDSHTHSNKTILDATTASFTTADETKLDGIADGATKGGTVQDDTTLAIKPRLDTKSGSATGNARGNDALDTQIIRNAATQVASGEKSIILGGVRNTASGFQATIINSFDSNATASGSVVIGGSVNNASGRDDEILGSQISSTSGHGSTIVGGYSCNNSGDWGIIAGGISQTINQPRGSILGGSGNTVDHVNSAVIGGTNITTDAADTVYVPSLNVGAGFKMPTGASANYALLSDASGNGTWQALKNWYVTKLGNETSDATTSSETTWYAPADGKIYAVHAGATTAASGGNLVADVKINGSSIMSNAIIIENTEYDTSTATTQPTLLGTPTSFTKGDAIRMNVNSVTAGCAGLHVDLLIAWD